MAVFYRLYVSV